MPSEVPHTPDIQQPIGNDQPSPAAPALASHDQRNRVTDQLASEARSDTRTKPASESAAELPGDAAETLAPGASVEAEPAPADEQPAREAWSKPTSGSRAPAPSSTMAEAIESGPGPLSESAMVPEGRAELGIAPSTGGEPPSAVPPSGSQIIAEPHPSPPSARSGVVDLFGVERLVAQRLQQMNDHRMDQRKLARLLKAVIDQVSLTEGLLQRPITVGARDRLAETAATRLFRQPLKVHNLPRLLAEAAAQLPAVAARIDTEIDDGSSHRRDRIDARQLRRARQAGVLRGLDPWD